MMMEKYKIPALTLLIILLGGFVVWCVVDCHHKQQPCDTHHMADSIPNIWEQPATIENNSHSHIISDPDRTVDTIIGSHYHIAYTLQSNDDFVTTYSVAEGKGIDTIYYADKSCSLSIFDISQDCMLVNRVIDKSLFLDYIPQSDLPNYSLCYFGLSCYDKASNIIIFSTNLCIPDTDICYDFLLHVTSEGTIMIKMEE